MIKVTANYNGRRAEFWMPCSESEMHKCFEQLQISEEHGTSLFVQTVIRPSQLAFLEDAFVDMDELNFLAKRLNCFSDLELDTFYGMIRHKGFTQMKDLINATYNLDNYTLVQDFRHIAFVGRTHYHALHGRITETAEKETDFAKLGRDLLASGSGIITDYGMLFPNEGKIFDEVYDGQVFPVQYHDDDSLVDVRMDFGGKTEVVFLPNHPIAITKALRRLGADSISLQNTFSHDLSRLFASGQSLDLSGQSTSVLMGSFSVANNVTINLFNILALIAFAYCVVKIFFQNIKRGGILLVQMAVGSLYMFSVPRGYTDGFYQWCKQVAALCLTAFMQTTLLFLGLLTFPGNMLLGLGIMLAANEVPRIAQQFGLDSSVRVNMMSVVHATTTAVNLTRSLARAK